MDSLHPISDSFTPIPFGKDSRIMDTSRSMNLPMPVKKGLFKTGDSSHEITQDKTTLSSLPLPPSRGDFSNIPGEIGSARMKPVDPNYVPAKASIKKRDFHLPPFSNSPVANTKLRERRLGFDASQSLYAETLSTPRVDDALKALGLENLGLGNDVKKPSGLRPIGAPTALESLGVGRTRKATRANQTSPFSESSSTTGESFSPTPITSTTRSPLSSSKSPLPSIQKQKEQSF